MRRVRGAAIALMVVLLSAALWVGLAPGQSAVTLTAPYSTRAVALSNLDGNPATGDWSEAATATVPLDNGETGEYGSATLHAKHDGTYLFLRLDGKIDVPWTSASGNHFWVGFMLSPPATTGHHRAGQDSIFFGETTYSVTDYLAPVDTNGGGKPPAKDTIQDAQGRLGYTGTSAPYSFTAEWRKKLSTGDGQDIALLADGTTAYAFYVSTDSDGGGSSGGSIDHSSNTHENILMVAPAPSADVHDVAVTGASVSPSAVVSGESVTVAADVANEGTVSETFSVRVLGNPVDLGAKTVTLAAGASTAVSWTYSTAGVSAGTYTIQVEAVAVAGETDLADNVRTAGTLSVSPPPALLRVTTNPAVPGKIIVDGVPRDEWGLNWLKLPAGAYTVSFGDVYGLGTPAPVGIDAAAGATTEVVGTYEVFGSLRVTTEPALPATIYVNGVARDDWGMWQALPAGTYEVSFGLVAGFDPPAPQTVSLAAGGFQHVIGRFTENPSAPGPDPQSFGYLRVTTSPAVASQISVNGIPRDEWGLNWLKLPAGTYTISFKGVYGMTPPASATVTVPAGTTTSHEGTFLPHGSLQIMTSPALPATVSVDGIPRDDWGMWQSFLPGTYSVSFGSVPGYATPAPQTVSVVAGALTSVTGIYTPLATASVRLDR